MISYGHEAFIEQAIAGVMMQKTNFSFELIIANDCSPDTTDRVVKELIDAVYPKAPIKYFNHTINKGMYGNFVFALAECKAKYIALCEGDDFWTDPYKLQKQVDFLEAHPEYEVCFTNIKVMRPDGSTKHEQLISDGRKDTYEQKDLPIWSPTLTRVFRNRDFTGKFPDAPGLDTVMLLYQSQFGKIKFINEVSGTYRLHDGGIYSAQSEAKRKEAVFLTFIECLKLVDASLLLKYFGMLFKKLIELSTLDKGLFVSNSSILKDQYHLYHKALSINDRIKINISFILLKSLYIIHYKFHKRNMLKIINRLLIYKQ